MHPLLSWPWATDVDWSALGTWAAVATALWIAIRDGWRRDAERHDAEKAQARLVMVDSPGGSGGGYTVRITNHSAQPVIGLEVDNVERDPSTPGEQWRKVRVFGARTATNVLQPGEHLDCPIEFVNEAGERVRGSATPVLTVTYSFHDASGLTWRKVGNSQPQRVLEHPLRRRGWRRMRN